ncbi:MAG: SPFH domain-containing protein [Gammaproteobacteria bacterium]
MVFLDGIKRQLRSVIEWRNPHPDALFQQWSDNGDEIKNASKLIIGPGQGCIFVYEGRVTAVLQDESMIELSTANIPFWTTVKKFMQFFESEHKVAIYFFKKTAILDQKWGTTSPIKYEDPQYKFPVGLKAFGNYSYRIRDAEDFFINVVGSHNDFYIDNFREIMSARIMQPLADLLAENKFSYAEIDANREEIAEGMHAKLADAFQKLGFEITDFRIEGTQFDNETIKRINRIADLTAEAHAAQAVGIDYTKLQQIEAMRDAARNEGGGAGIGMGMGAGIGLGQTMAHSLSEGMNSRQNEAVDDPLEKLRQLKKLHEADLITAEEYATKKKNILDNL